MPSRYLAIWIDAGKPADQAIVCCEPLLKDENTARTVLNSLIHQDYPGMILVGSETHLADCMSAIENADDEWGKNPDEILSNIQDIAKNKHCSTLWVRGSQRVQSPRPQEPVDAPDKDGLLAETGGYPQSRPEGSPFRPPKEGLLAWDIDEDEDEKEDEMDGIPARKPPSTLPTATAGNLPSPAPKKYPRGISEAAKPLWDKLLENKEHKANLRKIKDKQRKWAYMLALMIKAARKVGIKSGFEQHMQNSRHSVVRDIAKRIESGNDAASSEVEKTFDILKSEHLVTRMTKETFDSVEKHKGNFYIVTKRKVSPKGGKVKKTPADVLKKLAKLGYRKGKNWAHKSLDLQTEVMWEAVDDKIIVQMKTYLTKDQAKVFLDADDAKDEDIIKDLARVARKWVQTRELDPRKVLAALNERGHEDLAKALAGVLE